VKFVTWNLKHNSRSFRHAIDTLDADVLVFQECDHPLAYLSYDEWDSWKNCDLLSSLLAFCTSKEPRPHREGITTGEVYGGGLRNSFLKISGETPGGSPGRYAASVVETLRGMTGNADCTQSRLFVDWSAIFQNPI
jgi:hypothetical protein